MKKTNNKSQAHKVSTKANKNLVINGVEINKPLGDYKSTELGISGFACMVYNTMAENAPEVFKLAAVNNKDFTKFMILKEAHDLGMEVDELATTYMLEAVNLCKAIALTNEDKSTISLIEDLDNTVDYFTDECNDETFCNLSLYAKTINQATKIDKDPEYKAILGVLLVAMGVGFGEKYAKA